MNRSQFIEAVVAGARARNLAVTHNRNGRVSICFNATSKKSLHADHLGKLFDCGYAEQGRTQAERNALVKQVAPGRPCTHRELREIVEAMVPSK